MSWLSDFRLDVKRYADLSSGSTWKLILTEQGLWALLQYRLHAAVYRSSLWSIVKLPLHLMLTAWHKAIEITTGISLPCTARIGPGLHLPHGGLRVLNGSSILGSNCCLSHGVTIGISGRGERKGVPVIGHRVYLGVNAVVVGKISVGDDSVIGANSLINRDVPPHCTVMGVPATVINQKGSEDYLGLKESSLHQAPSNQDIANAKLHRAARLGT